MTTDDRSLSWPELIAWCVLTVGLIAVKLFPSLTPNLSNDSFQYLSVAENFLSGLPGYSSIVHFDEERARGAIPTPMTTFPPGYSLATAGFAATGLSYEHAALLVSVLATLVSVLLLRALAPRFGAGPTATRVALALFIVNESTILFAGMALSESLFTALVLAAVAQTVYLIDSQAQVDKKRAMLLAIGTGLCLGLCYWVRYAGLFVLVGFAAYAGLQLLLRNLRVFGYLVVSLGVGALLVAAGLLRNVALAGNWRGGNTKVVQHGLGETLRALAVAIDDITFGLSAVHDTLLLRVFIAGGVAVGAVVFLMCLRRVRVPALMALLRGPVALLAVLVAVYGACMTYASMVTVISFDSRMLFPMLPEVALLVAAAIALIGGIGRDAPRLRAAFVSGVTLVALGYMVLHASSSWRDPFRRIDVTLASALQQPVDARTSAYELIKATVGGQDVIMANFGQAMAYVLHQPTVSLTEAEYSNMVWDEGGISSTAQRFGAKLLVLYHPTAADIPSEFLAGLERGASSHALAMLARTDAITIYKLNP